MRHMFTARDAIIRRHNIGDSAVDPLAQDVRLLAHAVLRLQRCHAMTTMLKASLFGSRTVCRYA